LQRAIMMATIRIYIYIYIYTSIYIYGAGPKTLYREAMGNTKVTDPAKSTVCIHKNLYHNEK
jgi:hypothetical protein